MARENSQRTAAALGGAGGAVGWVEVPVGGGHLVGFTLGGVYGLSPIFPSYEKTYRKK